jgi:hypothetical protein
VERSERKRILLEYMRMKIEERDWHGVQDAASDMRDIEAEERGVDWANELAAKGNR